MRKLKQIKNIRGKTALVRVDFNVPIKNGKVLDDFRIRQAIPTIKFLEKEGAKIILITHLGKDGSEGLEPVMKCFFKISGLSTEIVSPIFSSLRPSLEYKGGTLGKLKNRRNYLGKTEPKVFFFENIRKFKGEMENDLDFAKKLAKLGDFYVNEAFSVSHRMHASIARLPKLLPSYAGLQLESEVKNLTKVFKKPKHPFLFILGGAKFSTKMPLIKKYLKLADKIFIGGALANNFLREKGYEVGKSLVSENIFGIGNVIKNKKIILPIDVVSKDEAIIDIGRESINNLKSLIRKSKLVLWNGPLGKYEDKNAGATKDIARFLLKQKGKEIILGGGDLVSQIPKNYLKPSVFISTGGGATLDFLTNGTLPGIKALK